MIVQIYEIQTPKEAEKCIELGVDHIGSVIFSRDNWRVPSLKDVIRLSEGTNTKNSMIPLFRDIDTIYRALDYYGPHYVHFCERLTENDGQEIDLDVFIQVQSNLKEKFSEVGIMRSIPIPENRSFAFPTIKIAHTLEPVSDIFLTDTWLRREAVEGYIGITGKTCDWAIARELVLQSKLPVILAGGLSPENVYDAMMETLPAGADSCTRTNMVDQEGKPVRFRKDFGKVEKFVKEVRHAGEAIHLSRSN